ncbi:AraC family ligand binding domain-containing protein [Microbulbifer echini]|uniref:AraC family ligand binding domain-containing protein n=1 Tax=Microbulbifer echini TaxID=1529067 RepID=A0ABV4NL40_9GAMM
MQKEFSKVWRNVDYPGIELFHAYFHQFCFGKHWHDELAIGIIQAGAEQLDYRGETAILPQGSIVAINPSEVHTGFSGSDHGWHYRMFYFDTGLIEQILQEHNGFGLAPTPFLRGPNIYDPQLFSLFDQLHRSLEEESLALASDSLLTIAITQIFTRHGDQKFQPKSVKDKRAPSLAKAYLRENWQRNVTLDELCHYTDVSRYQLIRSFNRQFGITPHQFLILLKTQQARTLFQAGGNSAEVAIDCGFFDQSHLTRNFKKAFGITPGRYIQSM